MRERREEREREREREREDRPPIQKYSNFIVTKVLKTKHIVLLLG